MSKELWNSLFPAPQRSPSFSRHHQLCDFGAESAGSRGRQRGLSEPRAPLDPAPRHGSPMRRRRHPTPANESTARRRSRQELGGRGTRGPGPAPRRPAAHLVRFTPMARLRSQRYVSKPSERRVSCTKETWDESMLCRFTPLELMSQQASLMRSLRASSTFFRMEP